MERWTVTDLEAMNTYKKTKADRPISEAKKNKVKLLALWNARSGRPSPHCSPSNSDDEIEDDEIEQSTTMVTAMV